MQAYSPQENVPKLHGALAFYLAVIDNSHAPDRPTSNVDDSDEVLDWCLAGRKNRIVVYAKEHTLTYKLNFGHCGV